MVQEFSAQKPRPVGLNAYIDGGVVPDATHLSILRDIEVFKSPKCGSQEPRPAGLKDSVVFPACVYVREETSSEEINPMQVKPRGNSSDSESSMYLFQSEEALELEDQYQVHGFNLPELGLLGLGNEFMLESSLFSDGADSGEYRETSKIIPEKAVNLVEVPTLVPSEPKVMKEESQQPSHSANFKSTRIETDTGNLSVGDPSLLTSVLGMTLEGNMALHETDFHWLHQGNSHSIYRWDQNGPTSTQVVQTN